MTERTRYRAVTSEFTATVTEMSRVGTTHVRVTMTDVPGMALLDTIAIEVGDALRRYTVSATEVGLEFVAYRTRRGPATEYLDGLEVGAQVRGLGPERPVKTSPIDATQVCVVGDDTVVGVARAIGMSHPGRVTVGLLGEARAEDVVALTGAVVRVFDSEDGLLLWVTEQAGVAGTHFVLVGEQASNQKVRQHAFGLGVDKESVATRTFWRPDRAGLE